MLKNKRATLCLWNFYFWFWTSTNRWQYSLFKWLLSVHFYSLSRFLRYNTFRRLHGH
nr:MAG TPA: hypothetical protein [Bacteriophage sp.]